MTLFRGGVVPAAYDERADVVFAVERSAPDDEHCGLVHGRKVLRDIAARRTPPGKLAVIGVLVDFASDELGRLLAAVCTAKGTHEYQPVGAGRTPRTVTVYDLKTGATTTIPESELAPGMIRANVQGVGRVWVSAAQASALPRSVRHPPFKADVKRLIKRIHAAVAKVDDKTITQWEDGFRNDCNYMREIDRWLAIARFYGRLVNAHGVGKSLEWKGDLYQLAILAFSVPRESVLTVMDLHEMTRDEAAAMLRMRDHDA
jgi:hypothetical protein